MEEKHLNGLVKALYASIKIYTKDLKDPESWCVYYKKEMNLFFPEITYEEDLETFRAKMDRIYDLQIFAFLYVRLTNTSKYSKQDHQKTIEAKNSVIKLLELISEEEYGMLRGLLKANKHGLN